MQTETPVYPTPADAAIDALILAEMPDGSPVSVSVKVDTILDHAGCAHAPDTLRRLLATGLSYRLRRSQRKRKLHECEAA